MCCSSNVVRSSVLCMTLQSMLLATHFSNLAVLHTIQLEWLLFLDDRRPTKYMHTYQQYWRLLEASPYLLQVLG